MLDIATIGVVVAVVFFTKSSVQVVIPFWVIRSVAMLGDVAKPKRLLAIFKGVIRARHLLDRIVNVLVHVSSRIGTKVRFGLLPVIRERLFNTFPSAQIIFGVIVSLLIVFSLKGKRLWESERHIAKQLLCHRGQCEDELEQATPLNAGRSVGSVTTGSWRVRLL